MSNTEAFTVEQIAEALRLASGVNRKAAEILRCAPNTIKNYIDKYPELAAIRAEAVEDRLDRAETGLVDAVDEGNLTAIIFTLKTLGKPRGYIERGEMTGPNGGPIETTTLDSVFEIKQRIERVRNARDDDKDGGADDDDDGPKGGR